MHLTCSSGAQFVYFSSDSTVEDNSCHFLNICWKNVSNVSEKLFLENLVWNMFIWTASSEFGSYRLCEQRRFRRACASAESRQNLRCSLIQAVSQAESSDRKPDPWPLWMAGHAQLKFVMTECSKTQIRLTGLIWNDITLKLLHSEES